jgi:hypothetical protein
MGCDAYSHYFSFGMKFSISAITVQVTTEKNGIRLQTDFENVYVLSQTLTTAKPILEQNFKLVRDVLDSRAAQQVKSKELDELALKIVLQYFSLYSNWKTFYPNERDRDLAFDIKDLESPMTYDSVSQYLKGKYPQRFRALSAVTLGITLDQFLEYEKGRQEFMDRR